MTCNALNLSAFKALVLLYHKLIKMEKFVEHQKLNFFYSHLNCLRGIEDEFRH